MRHSETRSKPPSAICGSRKMCCLMRYEERKSKEGKKCVKERNWKSQGDIADLERGSSWKVQNLQELRQIDRILLSKNQKKKQATGRRVLLSKAPRGVSQKVTLGGTRTCKCRNGLVQGGLKTRQMLQREEVCEEMWTGCGSHVKFPLKTCNKTLNFPKMFQEKRFERSHKQQPQQWLHLCPLHSTHLIRQHIWRRSAAVQRCDGCLYLAVQFQMWVYYLEENLRQKRKISWVQFSELGSDVWKLPNNHPNWILLLWVLQKERRQAFASV